MHVEKGRVAWLTTSVDTSEGLWHGWNTWCVIKRLFRHRSNNHEQNVVFCQYSILPFILTFFPFVKISTACVCVGVCVLSYSIRHTSYLRIQYISSKYWRQWEFSRWSWRGHFFTTTVAFYFLNTYISMTTHGRIRYFKHKERTDKIVRQASDELGVDMTTVRIECIANVRQDNTRLDYTYLCMSVRTGLVRRFHSPAQTMSFLKKARPVLYVDKCLLVWCSQLQMHCIYNMSEEPPSRTWW